MEQLVTVTKSSSINHLVSKVMAHFNLDTELQLTEITKTPPITVQAEGPACARAVSIAEIAIRRLERAYPFFLIYQYNLVTQVERETLNPQRYKPLIPGWVPGTGKHKSQARVLRKRAKRQARRLLPKEERETYLAEVKDKMVISMAKKAERSLRVHTAIDAAIKKVDAEERGEPVPDPPTMTETGLELTALDIEAGDVTYKITKVQREEAKRKAEQGSDVEDDENDGFVTAEEDIPEEKKLFLVPMISISISFSRLIRDGWTPQIRGG
ncbi:hypothetical protein V1512DRAFT_245888 [Lipomyces arxii]|uniref:uncharacterized protein n=1 Tax=Lipomyces arxii TaxID=56418 RepID=UPI0034CE8708